ncbi:Glutamate receptor-like protein [Quillaja saponaria]|uniref:Glutamate receptor-like protein n=1 Tax=Quillaja saponaria TaxID=32244 RepID=A0AAD7QES0_QUISA|nr:Glutamate receptor-like protein [Quillaja saponaria]
MANCLFYLFYSLALFNLLQFGVLGSSPASSSVGHEQNAATAMEPIKFRIGVPKKEGFNQFVKVERNHDTNKYEVTGFCIDVFIAAANILPFEFSFEFEPYVDETGKSAGTYDELLNEIPRKYDAVVGDVTNVGDRKNYVDFTLPYTETGVAMLARIQHRRHLHMWNFLRPFSWDLWLTILIFCVFIGVVIRIMERNVRRSEMNSSSSSITRCKERLTVVSSTLWFPLSQAVIPQRELVAKNCSRFVLVVWILLAFVLMQSYTASLSSILTLDQLNVEDLRATRHKIGYQSGSFVGNQLLVQHLNFDPKELEPYNTDSEYDNALRNGHVAAVFDEIPYINLFLEKYGSNYVMIGPTYPTDGFGFAFAHKSNLTSYFSRAILNLYQSYAMHEIENKYFGSKAILQSDPISSSNSPSPSLTAYSFAGLFMISGIATLLALIYSQNIIWRKPIANLDPSTDGSTTRNNVDSTDEANGDGQLCENDESHSETRQHNQFSPCQRNASPEIQLAVQD